MSLMMGFEFQIPILNYLFLTIFISISASSNCIVVAQFSTFSLFTLSNLAVMQESPANATRKFTESAAVQLIDQIIHQIKCRYFLLNI